MADTINFDLSGKVAVITGASKGIGLAIAEAYAAAGARVVLSSRKQAALDEAAERIWERGQAALPVAAHTGDATAVQKLVERVLEQYGRIDILVNNAAANPHFGHILTAEESHFTKTFDTNVTGYFRMAKACAAVMRRQGGGKIINVASVAGKTPLPMMGVYCVTKAGVLMLTEVLAAELAQFNIQVNAIAPGFVKTKFSAALWGSEQIYAATVKAIPQGRMGEAEEITGVALYLASAASSFTTGATFVVDGGQLVASPMGI
jgi:NAD(P)-dependent dehydrogenase (short-subunit alcohol dehydrogenase family)